MSEPTTFIMPTDPVALNKIKKEIKEISDCMIRIAAEKDAIKSIVEALSEEHEIPKKFLNKLARTYYRGTFDKEVMEGEDFQALYEQVLEIKNSN